MMASKTGRMTPVRGYPSIIAAVSAMRAAGKSPRETADELSIPIETVYQMHSRAAARGRWRRVHISVDGIEALREHADRRGMSVNQLCARIIETVADDDSLVNAVLDDGDEA